jgi:hypothetical protein
MIVKLCKACDQMPSTLYISGVTRCDEQPRFCGGFGDIFQAFLPEKNLKVALKRIRQFPGDKEPHRMRQVRSFVSFQLSFMI